MNTSEERGLATLTHILGLITGFLGPLIVYLIKTEEGLVRDQAREALNFQITVMIAFFVSGILALILIGLVLMLIVFIADLVLCIMAALATNRGERYRYPLSIRLIAAPSSPSPPAA